MVEVAPTLPPKRSPACFSLRGDPSQRGTRPVYTRVRSTLANLPVLPLPATGGTRPGVTAIVGPGRERRTSLPVLREDVHDGGDGGSWVGGGTRRTTAGRGRH